MKSLPAWSIVIFAARETAETLAQSIAAAMTAAPPGARIDVLVNGNPELLGKVKTCCPRLRQGSNAITLRLWFIRFGDKANAWNQYFQHIWSGQELVFFLDGYVQVNPDAIRLLGAAVMARDVALGGSGVPTVGRSAAMLRAYLLKYGGIHGNLCCVKGGVIGLMRERGIRLPVGLYRTDSLVENFLTYNLAPDLHEWEDARVYVHPTASWLISVPHGWSFENIKARAGRFLRQARGAIENAVFKEFFAVQKLPFQVLAASCRDMVDGWIREYPGDAKKLFLFQPLRLVALYKLRQFSEQGPDDLVPVLAWTSDVPPSEAQ